MQNRSRTMQVFDFSPMKESRKTCVSFEALKGRWAPLRPKARMHSFSARSDLLISAPSMPKTNRRKFQNQEHETKKSTAASYLVEEFSVTYSIF